MGNNKAVKIIAIFAVIAVLFGIVYMKGLNKGEIGTSETTETQTTETVDNEAKPEENSNMTDSELYDQALKNDLPTMLEFKTSA